MSVYVLMNLLNEFRIRDKMRGLQVVDSRYFNFPMLVSLNLHSSVNSEILARVLFSRNFASKTLAKWRNPSDVY